MENCAILSHKHKFIFLKTIKVAGTSLEMALSKYCGADDIITPILQVDEATRISKGYKGAQNYGPDWTRSKVILNKFLPKKLRLSKSNTTRYYNHMEASKLKGMLPDETWETYFKFTIIRNPYDRVISHYFWKTRKAERRPDFRTWLMKSQISIGRNQLIYMVNDKPVVDFFVRFEKFEEDLALVSSKIGINENIYDGMKSLSAKTGIRKANSTASKMFDGFAEGKRFVEEHAAFEFEIGDYDKM